MERIYGRNQMNDGGSAFPRPASERHFPGGEVDVNSYDYPESGMTSRQYAAIKLCVPNSGADWLDKMIQKALRDRFAGQAMAGMRLEAYAIRDAVVLAYEYADIMLVERGGRQA